MVAEKEEGLQAAKEGKKRLGERARRMGRRWFER